MTLDMYSRFMSWTPFVWAYGAVLSRLRGKFSYRHILSELGQTENDTILDVGTGYGSIFLADFPAKPSEVIGLDYSKKMITNAGKNAASLETRLQGTSAKVIRASSTDMPLRSDYFDLVIDSWQFPHLAKWSSNGNDSFDEQALSEYNRVVKPGGNIVLFPSRPWNGLPYWSRVCNRIEAVLERTIPESRYYEHKIPKCGSAWIING